MLLKTWFGLVCTILLASLFILIFNFNVTRITHWVSMIALILAVALTILVYLEQPHKKEIARYKKIYEDYAFTKDKIISDMKDKNNVLFKTAMKHSEENIQLAELKRKLEEKTK
jgi:hypothetical protein